MIRQDNTSHTSSHTSSMVWLVLFSILIILSVITNTAHTVSILARRQFSLPHLVLATFFLVNLVDYTLLISEFSVSEEHQYPYSQAACTAQQTVQHVTPLLTGTAVIIYSQVTLSPRHTDTARPARLVISLVLAALLLILLLPSVFFSEVAVYPSTATYCVIDLSGLANKMGLDVNIVTALYFILYKSVLAYWLPLLLTAIPLVKTLKNINFSDEKYSSQSLSLTVVISFFVFHLPLATLHLTRYSLGQEQGQAWTVQVLHSLFLLLSFFFHIFRPVACLVLSSDGRQTVKTGGYHQVDSQAQLAA